MLEFQQRSYTNHFTYNDWSLKWVFSANGTLQIIRRNVFTDFLLHNVHDPGCGVVTKVRQGHGGRGVDTSQKPKEDDRKEATDAKEDQNTSGMDYGAHEEEQTKEREKALQGHGHGPTVPFDLFGQER